MGGPLRKMLRGALVLAAVAVVAVVVGAFLARSSTPALPLTTRVDHETALVLREVLENIGDPRKLAVGDTAEVTLSQAALDALAIEASRRVDGVAARVTVRDGAADLVVSAVSPRPALTPYVDVRATVTGALQDPRLRSVRLGALPLPSALVQPTFDALYAKVRGERPWVRAVVDAVEHVSLHDGEVTVRYRWTEALAREVRSTGRRLLVGELGVPRVVAYQEALARVVEATPPRQPLPLVRLLPPLFAEARDRAERSGTPRLELQAALLVATFHALGRPLGPVLGADVPRLPTRRVVLWDRPDLPKHFLVSALLALWGDRAFADALGLSKEVTDSQGGSGFSFADLSANRAGTALATKARTSPEAARALVDRLARPLEDADLVPSPTRLPEGLTEEAFVRVYRKVGSPEYRALVARIDARIATTAVQRALADAQGVGQ